MMSMPIRLKLLENLRADRVKPVVPVIEMDLDYLKADKMHKNITILISNRKGGVVDMERSLLRISMMKKMIFLAENSQ